MTQTEQKFDGAMEHRAPIWRALNGGRWDELQAGRRALPERRVPELVVPGPNLTRGELDRFLVDFLELRRPEWNIRLTQTVLKTAIKEICETFRYRRFVDYVEAIARAIQPSASHQSSRPTGPQAAAMENWLKHVRDKLSAFRR